MILAVPLLSSADPTASVPLKNSTTPVGVPAPEAGTTEAESDTGVPEPTVTVAGERLRLVVEGVVPPMPANKLKTVPELVPTPPGPLSHKTLR